ncbi:MAG: DUF4189 domain-containing protein [Rhodospirillaceae bacterium]|jgi:hypothetical protein|nr:DUF4189 domain-containing protein [Rhodospirillaceae bacterium]MBT6119803.1 DUF4189 domain-containing protein [Rhodospirillaceae bacterium]
MLRAATIILCVFSVFGEATAQENLVLEKFEAAGWTGFAWKADDESSFEYCDIKSVYGTDTIVEFDIAYDGDFNILLFSETYPVSAGQTFRMLVEIDDSFRQDVPAEVFDNGFVALQLGAYQDVIEAFRKGSSMRIAADAWTDGFELTGTDMALRRLEICYKTYVGWRARLFGAIAGTSYEDSESYGVYSTLTSGYVSQAEADSAAMSECNSRFPGCEIQLQFSGGMARCGAAVGGVGDEDAQVVGYGAGSDEAEAIMNATIACRENGAVCPENSEAACNSW